MTISSVRSNGGFTLIEVLVASAIVITSMGLLLALMGSGLDRLHRVGAQAQLIIAQKQISNRLSTINPAVVNSAEGQVAGIEFSWVARPQTKFRKVADPLGEVHTSRVAALFSIEITLKTEPERVWTVTRLGWR